MAKRGANGEALSDRPAREGEAQPHRGPVLGIDPGLERTGYAVLCAGPGPAEARLVEAGLIRLSPREPLERRLADLHESLEMLLETHRPALLACEELYAHYKHPRTAILMAHARGVILSLAARQGIEVASIAATHVKKVLTGSGHAAKHQVQFAVAALLGLRQVPEPPDVADAIAIALCGMRLRGSQGVLRRGRRTTVGRRGRASRWFPAEAKR